MLAQKYGELVTGRCLGLGCGNPFQQLVAEAVLVAAVVMNGVSLWRERRRAYR